MEPIVDIADLEAQYTNITGCSPIDPLTGLYNHGFFGDLLSNSLSGATDSESPLSILMIDIDGFDHINSDSGYVTGDKLLSSVGNAISSTQRSGDIAARFQGDRFVTILKGSDTKKAHIAAERIRSAVDSIEDEDVSVSIGISSYPEDASSRKELITHAMQAVGHAKMRGRNRIYKYSAAEAVAREGKPHVLIVDDDEKNSKLLEAQLEIFDVQVSKAEDGYAALEIVEKTDTDLVLLDVMMPGIDGYQVCRRIKDDPLTRQIPVVLVTALSDTESRVKGIEAGADDFLTKPVNAHEFAARTRSLIKSRQNSRNYTSLESVLFSLANAVEAKDAYTQGHTERVSNLAVALGTKMGLTDSEVAALRLGGILHDVGKIAISSAILNKTGPLNEEEWEEMRTHPDFGYKICLPLAQSLGMALDVIRHHHEKLDGSSYPDGLRADEISIPARIMAVVDIYDALTSDRPYREALKAEEALRILRDECDAGKLDFTVVEALAAMVKPADKELRRTSDTGPGSHILVIDDDLLNQKLVNALLDLEGYQVSVAGSAEDGLEVAGDKRPDLILMDIQLPGMSGLDATKILKEKPDFEKVPVIALSAYAMKQDIEAARAAGCDDYVTKPVENARLISTIKKHLNDETAD